MRAHQLSFLPPPRLEHGGETRPKRRKLARPIDPKRPLHVVLRSSRARGNWSLLHPRHKGRVYGLVESISERYDVRVYRFANVGNHVHLLVQAKSRKNFQAFLRVLSGAIAFVVTGAKKGNPVGRFWDHLAYSRVVGWGKDFDRVRNYLILNLLEGFGVLKRGVGEPEIVSLESLRQRCARLRL